MRTHDKYSNIYGGYVKKIILSIILVLFVGVFMAACGDSASDNPVLIDAREVAQMRCKAREMIKNAPDRVAKEEGRELRRRAKELRRMYEDKYEKIGKGEEFSDFYRAEKKKCREEAESKGDDNE